MMAIETSAGATVSLNVPVTPPLLAVMEQVPAAFALSIPLLDIVATVLSEEFQVAEPVRSCWLLSLKEPVAVICWDWPATKLVFCPVIWTESSTTCGEGLACDPPPQAASVANEPNTKPSNAARIGYSVLRILVLLLVLSNGVTVLSAVSR
jgi:hypothetical protein